MIPDLSQVPKLPRAILMLRYWGNVSDSTIARYLGMRRTTVAKQVTEALYDVTVRVGDLHGRADYMPPLDPALPVQERVARILHQCGYSQREIARLLKVKRAKVASLLGPATGEHLSPRPRARFRSPVPISATR